MSNDIGASPTSLFWGNHLACLDRLPPAVRRGLHEGVVSWDPLFVRWQINKRVKAGMSLEEATAWAVAALRRWDDAEVAQFGRGGSPDALPLLRGCANPNASPHLAAGASIMRYDEAARVRRAKTQRRG